MRNMPLKLVLIFAVIVGCALAIMPPKEKIRLGKDLRGGVSLVYSVRIDETSNASEVLTQTIEVLKDRVNPQGVLDISMTPQGLDRIEIVMPLPSAEVKALKDAYEEALDTLLARAEIPERQLITAVQQGRAVDQFGSKVAALQNAWNAYRDAVQEYETVKDDPSIDPQELRILEGLVAETEIAYEDELEAVRALNLDRARVIRVLRRPNDAEPELDEAGQPVLDENGDPVMSRSQREIEMELLLEEFPQLEAELTAVADAWDAYDSQRTTLDDPEDLMKLLEGAGVLDFRIAVNASDTESGVNVQDMRAQLAERGPENTDSPVAAWFEINDLKQWYEEEADYEFLIADPGTFFAQRRDLVAGERDGRIYLLLYTTPAKAMTHDDTDRSWSIESASRGQDQMGRPAVNFRLDPYGGGLMSKLTAPHINRNMAIVLDGQVFSAPNLNSQIGSSGQITGSFSDADLSYLTRVLAAGSLEARLSEAPIATNVLGPSIGRDNLGRGLEACLIAVIAVAVFMILYYFLAGVVADFALIANGVIIFGVMALIDGTFTLPGLAGIVLTIGMAVDANVLIYERIREEIFAGEVDLRGAIRLGYQKALSTIIDANVTNLIVCLVLYKTATTEVKGFALTLSIGIVATLFTALFVTRQFYYIYTDVLKRDSLPMLPTVVPAVHHALEPNINWIGLRKIFWAISIVGVITSIGLVSSRGVEMFDTEFRGGVALTIETRVENEVPDADGGNPTIERLVLSQAEVTDRIHAIGERVDATEGDNARILAELANASVLTVGATSTAENGGVAATQFQIKVANPKGVTENETIMEVVRQAITDEFEGQLDIAPKLSFRGEGSENHANFTYRVESERLGDNLNRPTVATRVPEFVGGVAVVIDDIDPPVTREELLERIDRTRQQARHSGALGRDVEVVGLETTENGDRYTSVAVLVNDRNINLLRTDVSFDSWDRNLAKTEWMLISEALSRPPNLKQVTSFSSAVAETLKASAIVAVVLSLLGILVYIWVRFGSLRYSLAAIVALAHDVTIALGLIALTQIIGSSAIASWLFIEEFHVDLGVVAALLTIIGYSLNDTIVILDRVRENRGKLPLANAATINRSINQTVSRTLLTSVTTLMAVLIMYVEGGSGIRPFTFCLLIGLLVGTYSSVGIAAPLVFSGGDGRKSPADLKPSTDNEPAAI